MSRPALDPFETQLAAALPLIRPWALKYTKNNHARADDMLQDAAIRALAHRDSFQMGTNMKAWLIFIARNTFLTEHRRAWRIVDCFDDASRSLIGRERPDAQLELKEVLTALSFVPADQVEALMLVAMDGLSYEEAAAELDTEVGTIKSRVSSARTALDLYFQAGAMGSK